MSLILQASAGACQHAFEEPGSVGLLSVLIALITSAVAPQAVGLAGFIYFAIGLSEWLLGEYDGRMRRKIARSADPSHS